jgi:hypothetical protein
MQSRRFMVTDWFDVAFALVASRATLGCIGGSRADDESFERRKRNNDGGCTHFGCAPKI